MHPIANSTSHFKPLASPTTYQFQLALRHRTRPMTINSSQKIVFNIEICNFPAKPQLNLKITNKMKALRLLYRVILIMWRVMDLSQLKLVERVANNLERILPIDSYTHTIKPIIVIARPKLLKFN